MRPFPASAAVVPSWNMGVGRPSLIGVPAAPKRTTRKPFGREKPDARSRTSGP